MPWCDAVFFACSPDDLPKRFPGWLAPLRREILVEFTNPMTKQTRMIRSNIPPVGAAGYDAKRWDKYIRGVFAKAARGKPTDDEYAALGWPHFTTYNIAPFRLEWLARALRTRREFPLALYPPTIHDESHKTLYWLHQFPDTLTSKLASANEKTLDKLGELHADTGVQPRAAHRMVQNLAAIARSAGPGDKMYLFNFGPG
jgi:hypothetical protein